MILTSFSTVQENRAPFLQLKAKPYFVLTIPILCDLPSLVIPFSIFLPVYFHSSSDSSSSTCKYACLSHPSPYPANISPDTNLISLHPFLFKFLDRDTYNNTSLSIFISVLHNLDFALTTPLTVLSVKSLMTPIAKLSRPEPFSCIW